MRFIVFAEDWASHPSSTQHLFKVISKRHNTTWINSVGMRTPKLNLTDLRRVINKAKMMLTAKKVYPNAQQKKLKNLTVCNPLLLPWHSCKAVCNYNRWQLSKYIDLADPEPIIYWLSVPTAIALITVRPQDKLVYYCGDDFSALAGVDHKMVAQFEAKLIHSAQTIFVASEELLKKMPVNKTQLLEHGVDFIGFSKRKPKHPYLRDRKNVLGFYGSISNWLDLDLLCLLASQRPDYELVLVGTIHINIDALLKLPNVTHFDAIQHHQLASFSQHWQVSLLPFVVNEQIESCDPLKLKEYLAVGKPIVTTSFPAVEKYRSIVLIAQNHQDFIARVDQALEIDGNNALGWRAVSQSYVAPHSWQKKGEYVLNQLC